MNTVEIIQHAITKTNPSMKLWVTIKSHSKTNGIVISHIAKESPFYNKLLAGYFLLSVNGNSSFKTVEDAIKLMQACETTIRITTVSIPVPAGFCRLTTVSKALPTDVRFESTQTNLVRVASILNTPGRSFTKSPISQGDIVLSINNQVVSYPAAAAAHILTEQSSGEENDTCLVLFVPVQKLQRHAIFEAAHSTMRYDPRSKAEVPIDVKQFQVLVPNKSYKLEYGHCFPYPYIVEFVDYYTFQFEEIWLHMKAQADAFTLGGDYAKNKLFYGQKFRERVRPMEQKINQAMMANLYRLDRLVASISPHGSSSQGTSDLAITSSLKELADLKSRSLLTEEEFVAAKAKVLGLVLKVHTPPEATVLAVVIEDAVLPSAPVEYL